MQKLLPFAAACISWGISWFLFQQRGEILPQDVALHYLRALDAARVLGEGRLSDFLELSFQALPNPGLTGGWLGLWMALFGQSRLVAFIALFPLHLLAASGLFRGGVAAGGMAGGLLALLLGLFQPETLQAASSFHPDLFLFAASAALGAALLENKPMQAWLALSLGVATKLAAIPSLIGMISVAILRFPSRRWLLLPVLLAGLLYLPSLGSLGHYTAGSEQIAAPFQGMAGLLQRLWLDASYLAKIGAPVVPVALVLALLMNPEVIHFAGWSLAGLVGIALLPHQPQARYLLPMLPPLCFAAATLSGKKHGKALAGGIGAVQLGALLLYPSWKQPKIPDYDLDGVLDWLEAKAAQTGAQGKVALMVEPGGDLSGPAFLIRASERGFKRMKFAVVEENQPLSENTVLAVVLDRKEVAQRAGWLLPPPLEEHSWPGDYTLKLWDRGLPLEESGDTSSHHPASQALFVLLSEGSIQGPLLKPASSVAVAWKESFVALFVRDQRLWRSESQDGLSWSEPEDLSIPGVDPAFLKIPDGSWRVFYVEFEGGADQDPALARTQIKSLISSDLKTFIPEAGVRLAGSGLVDPSLNASGTLLYLTEGGKRIRRAVSKDGLNFTLEPGVFLEDSTVPEVTENGLILQKQVGAETLLYRYTEGTLTPLEVCGTGASVIDSRLYFTYTAQKTCGPPTVYPSRRGSL